MKCHLWQPIHDIYNTIKSLLKIFATKRLKELSDLALRVVSGNSFQHLTVCQDFLSRSVKKKIGYTRLVTRDKY